MPRGRSCACPGRRAIALRSHRPRTERAAGRHNGSPGSQTHKENPMRRAPILFAVGLAVAATATTATIAASGAPSTRATLRLADGTTIGTVRFHDDHGTTRVKVSLDVPDGKTAVRAFHGFHIHANDNPINGVGC